MYIYLLLTRASRFITVIILTLACVLEFTLSLGVDDR